MHDQKNDKITCYDEGFPYTFSQSACNFGKAIDNAPIQGSLETRDKSYQLAQSLLDHGSEHQQHIEYKFRELLGRFVGKYVPFNGEKLVEAVSFTNSGVIFRKMSKGSRWASEHKLPYTEAGYSECSRLLIGAI